MTTTDAAFLLGMLGSGRLAGGLSLDRGGAQDVADRLGQEIGLSSDALCRGVLVIAAASMANAIREITVEKGQDPRKAALVMFGGAGPMFGTLLMDELAIETMVVPPHAGNFSAVGLLGTNVARSLARTKILMLDDRFGAVAATELDMMFTELWERVGLDQRASTVEEVALDLRYHGQEHTLTIHVEVESGSLLEAPERIRARFNESYAARYGRALSDPVEAVAIRASLLSALSGERVLSIVGAEVTAEPIETVSAYSFRTEAWREFPVIARAAIAVHEPIIGPAIIVEETTTTYLDAGFTAALDVASGSLIITRTEVQK